MFARPTCASCRCLLALAGLLWLLAPTPALAQESLAIGAAASVASAEPVLLRTAPGWDAAAATEVAAGTQVTVLDGPVTAADGSLWYQVDVWGQAGYLPAYALAGAAAPADPATQAAEPVATEAPPAGLEAPAAETVPVDENWVDPAAAPVAAPAAPIGTAWIAGTNGEGAVCRAAADYGSTEVGWLAEGSAVEVTGQTVGEWQPINCNGTPGYVHASFLSWDPVAASTVGTAPADQTGVTDPSLAVPTDSTTADQTGSTDPSLAAPADPATTDPTVAADPAQAAPVEAEVGRERRGGRVGGGGGAGSSIASFALQYVGYPYQYAGEGPYAFDCSGFTKFVILNTLGIDITHDMHTQASMGTPVGQGELQPGDLVFFQNTFQAGLSHAGIYVGNGQFVHAENESTGVRVSDINSDYYASRWYGAVRLA